MARIRVEGLTELQNKLKENVSMVEVKRIVRKNGAKMTEKMIRNADFDKGYQTGTTKQSISLELEDSGFTASVEPKTEYSQYLEYGTRFMDAQPFVKPAFDEQKEKFKDDMARLTR